ncbi:glycoside hydrolase family 125 protein [Fundicoccus culcitae]|uniref:Glycoside hydrolase family 125 protein n=1 Tax=Fundicoccus culcitae TaxID=2969821 RepID=A0ABY5P947_9LACT|nr:glycoside hydrolase family 125 protein [Fundicoccus culcitae]UUX35273.1 glycoside hydrolase family 125 protein [Fundicoccus culcitae]
MQHNMVLEAQTIVSKNFEDTKIKELFNNVYDDALVNTIKILDDDSVFVLTGDIPAMWLRDSACQIRPYLPFINKYADIKELVFKLIKKQFYYISIDPYANAFNEAPNSNRWDEDLPQQKPIVWERKFELDSHCFPILLSYQYWKITDDNSVFSGEYWKTIDLILDIWEIEQKHESKSEYYFYRPETDYLSNKGKGSKTEDTEMIWSGFRPSDDPCEYHFNIPGNLFALRCLTILKEIISHNNMDSSLLLKIERLYQSIKQGINSFGIAVLPNGEKIFAYEVDGLGNQLLMDDSNMPSLLSIPLLSDLDENNEIYLNTRSFILSKSNPYFFEGSKASGVGSPHTPDNHIWPLSIAVEGLTTSDRDFKLNQIKKIASNDNDTLQVHESFHKDDASQYTREWFSWGNSMFCELVLDYCGLQI